LQVWVTLGAGLQKKKVERHDSTKFECSRTGDKIADATIADATN